MSENICKNKFDFQRLAINTLHEFIVAAEVHGMPVKMLRYLATDRSFKHYEFNFRCGGGLDPKPGEDRTERYFRNIILYKKTVGGLRHSGSDRAYSDAVQTLYHECTHAWIDLWEHDETSMFQRAIAWYEGQKLKNGKTVDDPERVAHEAAGVYVGHRVAVVWTAWQKMFNLSALLDKVFKKEMTAERGRQLHKQQQVNNGGPIPVYYDREMQDQVFGYQEMDGGQVHVVGRPIHPGLKAFCDGQILENKIKRHFIQMPLLRLGYDELQKRTANLLGR